MAIIKCPECEQDVSDKALKCPKCGCPIQAYLSSKTEKIQTESMKSSFSESEYSAEIQQDSVKHKSKKKMIVGLIAACIVGAAVSGGVLNSKLSVSQLTVQDIAINKWRVTDSTKYGYYYEGVIQSEQKKPFVAVIGQYEDEKSIPEFIYVEDGKGVMETFENTDEDPSIKYRVVGYMAGNPIKLSELDVKYKDSDYYDWEYFDYTTCKVLINIDMDKEETGLLVFDIINETNNETKRNMITVVHNGKAEYNYSAEIAYKARGIDVSIVPRLFCGSTLVEQDAYMIEKPYTAEKSNGTEYKSYLGEETFAFTDYDDGFVLYTEELKEGGNKANRNMVKTQRMFLHDGTCKLTTYDFVDADDAILMPKYEFNIIGYITWIRLEKETV